MENLDSLKQEVIKLSQLFYRDKKGVLYRSILEAVTPAVVIRAADMAEGLVVSVVAEAEALADLAEAQAAAADPEEVFN